MAEKHFGKRNLENAVPCGEEGLDFVGELVSREIYDSSSQGADNVEMNPLPDIKKKSSVLAESTDNLKGEKNGSWDKGKCCQRMNDAVPVLQSMTEAEIYKGIVDMQINLDFFRLLLSNISQFVVPGQIAPFITFSADKKDLIALARKLSAVEYKVLELKV